MAKKRNTGPLRKILRMENRTIATTRDGEAISVLHEILECGHAVLPREDIIGETNAYRRRCWRCARETSS